MRCMNMQGSGIDIRKDPVVGDYLEIPRLRDEVETYRNLRFEGEGREEKVVDITQDTKMRVIHGQR